MGKLRESAKKGFERYSRVDDALNLFLCSYNKYGSPLSNVDQIPLSDAVNRVLANDLHSPVNVPRFAQSAMNENVLF